MSVGAPVGVERLRLRRPRPRLRFARTWSARVALAVVVQIVLLAVIAAVAMFVAYYTHPEMLWRGDPSDRSVHFDQALRLAVTLRNLDFAAFWHEMIPGMPMAFWYCWMSVLQSS